MKLYNITDIDTFFNIVDSCDGGVYLVSTEGDKLNLKSKLCQYLAMAKMFSADYIKELSLQVDNDSDKEKFIHFMIIGNGAQQQRSVLNASTSNLIQR